MHTNARMGVAIVGFLMSAGIAIVACAEGATSGANEETRLKRKAGSEKSGGRGHRKQPYKSLGSPIEQDKGSEDLDRLPKKAAMIGIDVARAVLLTMIPWLHASGLLTSMGLYVLVFVTALFSMAFGPAPVLRSRCSCGTINSPKRTRLCKVARPLVSYSAGPSVACSLP